MQLKAQLQTLSKGPMPMVEYIDRKRLIVDSLAADNYPVDSEDLTASILFGLDASYGAFNAAFMMKSECVT